MAKVSILIPAYNAGAYISETIKSVLQQSYTDWELVIVDDNSADDTFAIAHKWAIRDPRIRVFSNQQNLGMLENWNYGIGLCSGLYFVKLDADDIWYPRFLEKSVAILDDFPQVGLVFTKYRNIDENGLEINIPTRDLPEFARNKSFSCIPLVKKGPDKMLSYPILQQGLSVMRGYIFEEIGKYRFLLTPETQASTDTEFYFRLGAQYRIHVIDEYLYGYRQHASSISSLDRVKCLQDKKMYETKTVILGYYYKEGHIPGRFFRSSLRHVKRQYHFGAMAQSRARGAWVAFISLLLRQCLTDPAGSVRWVFNRLKQKLNERHH